MIEGVLRNWEKGVPLGVGSGGLVFDHGADTVELACRRALHFGAADTAQRVENIIDRQLQGEPLPELDRVIDARARERDFERPMAEYEALLEEVVA